MKLFNIDYYESKIEDLERLAEVADHRAEVADKIIKEREEMLESFHQLYAVMKIAEAEQDFELEAYMGYSILERAAEYDIIKEGEVVSVDEIMNKLIKRVSNAYFEAIYYTRKSTETSKRIAAAAKVVTQLQKVKIFKLRAALAIGKMLFPGRFN